MRCISAEGQYLSILISTSDLSLAQLVTPSTALANDLFLGSPPLQLKD